MIKRKMGVLAGSILAATGSQAAIDLSGGELLAVFNTTGQGSYYQFVPGVSVGLLLDYQAALSTADPFDEEQYWDEYGFPPTSFSINVSAAYSALGGNLESVAFLALHETGNALAYNYDEFLHVDVGGGLLYTGNASFSQFGPNVNLQNQINFTQSFFSDANLGHNVEGSFGDFDRVAVTDNYLTSMLAPTPVTVDLYTLGASTDAESFNLFPALDFTPVPIPAAAWLFLSALGSISGVRMSRKNVRLKLNILKALAVPVTIKEFKERY